MITQEQYRCGWTGADAVMIDYHDAEWGVPVHDDRLHFEFLVLDAAQAGLSWRTVLHKRENYRKAFSDFDPRKVARFDDKKIAKLLENSGLIRNRLKIESAVKNAKGFLKVQDEFGSFDSYIWRFVDGRTMVNRCMSMKDVPAQSPQSEAMSKDMKRRGFTFCGPTICYAYMQAAGMVNDHEVKCFRYNDLRV
jgi:DNA-3-methyladenine glycosylase I